MTFGEYRGQDQRRGRTWRRWRADLRDDLGTDAVPELSSNLGIQLRCAGEELACPLGLLRAQPGQLK
jgi:hypothetical protein